MIIVYTLTPPICSSQTLKQLLEELRLYPEELLPPLAYLGVVLVEVAEQPVIRLLHVRQRCIEPLMRAEGRIA